jgi:hypothetical protein
MCQSDDWALRSVEVAPEVGKTHVVNFPTEPMSSTSEKNHIVNF